MGYNHQPPHVGLTKHGEGSILSRSGPLLVLLTTYFHHLLVALSPTDINAQPLLQYLYTLPWNPSKPVHYGTSWSSIISGLNLCQLSVGKLLLWFDWAVGCMLYNTVRQPLKTRTVFPRCYKSCVSYIFQASNFSLFVGVAITMEMSRTGSCWDDPIGNTAHYCTKQHYLNVMPKKSAPNGAQWPAT